MTDSILQERSFDELIKLYNYFSIKRSDAFHRNYDASKSYEKAMKDIDEIIFEKYAFEASNYYNQNHNPEN